MVSEKRYARDVSRGDLLQKLLRILAAFSHSLSNGSGKKPSDPNLFARALTGPATLLVKAWPKADNLFVFFFASPALP